MLAEGYSCQKQTTKISPDSIIKLGSCLSYWNLYREHIIHSAAHAAIVGTAFFRFTGKDPSGIIITVAFYPRLIWHRKMRTTGLPHASQNTESDVFQIPDFSI